MDGGSKLSNKSKWKVARVLQWDCSEGMRLGMDESQTQNAPPGEVMCMLYIYLIYIYYISNPQKDRKVCPGC